MSKNKKLPSENDKETETELLESQQTISSEEDQQNPDKISQSGDNPDQQIAPGDFLTVGRYTAFLIVLYELQLLPMVFSF